MQTLWMLKWKGILGVDNLPWHRFRLVRPTLRHRPATIPSRRQPARAHSRYSVRQPRWRCPLTQRVAIELSRQRECSRGTVISVLKSAGSFTVKRYHEERSSGDVFISMGPFYFNRALKSVTNPINVWKFEPCLLKIRHAQVYPSRRWWIEQPTVII